MTSSSRSRLTRFGLRRLELLPACVLIGTIALAVVYHRATLLERLELWTLDWRIEALDAARRGGPLARIARPSPFVSELVLVALDDTTLTEWDERLPIPRRRYAALLDRMKDAGAHLSIMDVFLVGKSRDPTDDESLAAAIARNGRVVYTRRGIREGPALRDQDNPVFFGEHMQLEVSALLHRDADAVVRHYTAGEMTTDGLHPSVALLAASDLWHLRASIRITEGRELVLEHEPLGKPGAGLVRVELSAPHNMFLLDLAGPVRPFDVVSMSHVDRELARDPDRFRNKIVLIGNTYSGAHDLHPVPVSPEGVRQMEGSYLHAYAVRDLLTGNAGYRLSVPLEALAIALWLVTAGALFWHVPLSAGVGLLILLELAWLAGAFWAYLARGAWVPLAVPLLGPAALFVETLALKLREEGKGRRSAEVLLSSYFSPAQAAGLEGADDPNVADRLLAARQVLAPDKYEIVGKLGQGGMSVVFRAIQHPLGRTVALKFISPRLYRDRDAVARFLREARLAGQLMHPNLVAVFDSGASHGVPYIALEYVDGENLKSLIARRGQLTPAEVVGLLIQTLDGLEHVHRAGIIHRDVKTENILLSKEGVVKLTDFGIAKSEGGDAFETLQQVIVGTPAYLSPEQIKGERLTPASDLYALGIVLYEMLSGSPPFLGDSTGAILLKHLHDVPPDLAALGLDLPRGLLAVLRRCLEKDPADRYAGALEMKAALAALHLSAPVAGLPGEAAPPRSSSATLHVSRESAGGNTDRVPR